MELRVAEFNLDCGGLRGGLDGARGDYDFSGLVDAMHDDWPDILVLCEGAFYSHNGGAGAFGAAAAMREAGGRAYTPLPGTLTGGRGPLAPVVYVDPQTVTVRHWYSGHEPDHFTARSNLLVFTLPGSTQRRYLIAVHFDVRSHIARIHDAETLRPWANPATPCLIAGDFNSHPSGPHWRVTNFDQTPSWRHMSKTRFPPEIDTDGTARPVCDTEPLDRLLGVWHEPTGRRVGGAGFLDVAELVGDYTPTVNPSPAAFGPMTLDRFLVNDALTDAVTDYRVRLPADPQRPPSSHRRISLTLDL
ncbi:endonuclease/exonuclease/phosphatase family protein [Saccharopolyspora sp. K220]|uniref:endonuclease/exonuclease/phosphatase family protein n=1 Tax=Saccharopolyspora soli TaxID=2926618 RepID=UPI001F596F9E|nr:endonuclease/exonuclease/phosphatase family protein [Saccharopolyspora soli]MCI2422887.1 endonuclease/exonuclease/phosphatase family protein [Saccharopolyspora soli]